MTLTDQEQRALDELVWELSKPHTARAISQRLGMTYDRVARIEFVALRKLKERARKEVLR
jgi:DNA-directed RNA polymerase sigma subunit (sigma70/sigma32)